MIEFGEWGGDWTLRVDGKVVLTGLRLVAIDDTNPVDGNRPVTMNVTFDAGLYERHKNDRHSSA